VTTAAQLIARLHLREHPEGGWYREVHRGAEPIATSRGPRAALTSIYYLLEAGQKARWHMVTSDEIWHFHDGAPLELLAYEPARMELIRQMLGPAGDGREPIGVVRAGLWQAARSRGDWTLVGCDVGPGFDFADFSFVDSLADHARHFAGPLAPYATLL
jgi:uncharacterized protein